MKREEEEKEREETTEIEKRGKPEKNTPHKTLLCVHSLNSLKIPQEYLLARGVMLI